MDRIRGWFRPFTRRRLAVLVTALALALIPAGASAYPNPGLVTGDIVVHDPSMIRASDGTYLLYSTHGGLEARTSTDRIAFRRAGNAFNTPPSWWRTYSPGNDAWAPDISFQNGRYLLYYAVSTFGSSNSAIGLATSSSGRAGTWTDQGIVHSTTSGGTYNAIDPNLFVDSDGRWWLDFGSWGTGIKMIRLDPATGKQSSGDRTVYSLASRPTGTKAVEGPTLVKRNGFYYLFASYDTCCAGTSSTYKIKVGRATSPTGPFVDASGVAMMNNGGTPVLETHGRYIGPGGQSLLSDVDGDLLVYHYYDRDANGTPKLGVNLISWSGGWPTAF